MSTILDLENDIEGYFEAQALGVRNPLSDYRQDLVHFLQIAGEDRFGTFQIRLHRGGHTSDDDNQRREIVDVGMTLTVIISDTVEIAVVQDAWGAFEAPFMDRAFWRGDKFYDPNATTPYTITTVYDWEPADQGSVPTLEVTREGNALLYEFNVQVSLRP